jgi:hypothetical protein
LLEVLQQYLFRGPQRRGDPAGGIAANVLATLQASAAADSGRIEIAACAAQARAIQQSADLRWRQELIPN